MSFEPSVNMTIKNKNRKDRSKHDKGERIPEHEIPGTSSNTRYNYSYTKYAYTPRNEISDEYPGPHRGRAHACQRKEVCTKERDKSFNQYSSSSNQKRHWSSSVSLENPKKNCDRRPSQAVTTELGEISSSVTVSEDGGNNSEDEYYIATGTRPLPTTKVGGTNLAEENNLEDLLIEKKGWKIVHVGSDGACLFRSVAHQIFGDEEKHHIIRTQVLDYMTKNEEHFSQYITEDFSRYIERKKNLHCHGNHVEIQAIAELYNRPVEIYHSTAEPINVFQAEYSNEPPIRLSYHGRVHYNSVVDPFNPSFGHGLGMPNYQPGLPEPDLIARAMDESENTHIEDAMLRDKLAETEQREIEQCIEDQVVRESYFEHMSGIRKSILMNIMALAKSYTDPLLYVRISLMNSHSGQNA
ncbi:unnamed protein product [Protopolystoma xenopodis]|uniref:ubiquitinyl hydrolase 1 n=1 Tax=Protopolystoma xenopodis TaxID=117903 RepID=A0A448WSD2_9PLAT|nr:unnamed protein product [Protopolystoma xenopodis]